MPRTNAPRDVVSRDFASQERESLEGGEVSGVPSGTPSPTGGAFPDAGGVSSAAEVTEPACSVEPTASFICAPAFRYSRAPRSILSVGVASPPPSLYTFAAASGGSQGRKSRCRASRLARVTAWSRSPGPRAEANSDPHASASYTRGHRSAFVGPRGVFSSDHSARRIPTEGTPGGEVAPAGPSSAG